MKGIKIILCEILSSHGVEYEAQNLLRCTAVFFIEYRPTFQRYVLPPSPRYETSVNIKLRTRKYYYTALHCEKQHPTLDTEYKR
jgi:hypothetical protein